MSRNRNVITLSMVFVLTAVLGTAWAASSPPVMQFESSFEASEGANRFVGADVVWNDPNIGLNFNAFSGASDQFVVVDTPAIGGLAMSCERRNNLGQMYFMPRPQGGLTRLFQGQTIVLEIDAYVPTGASADIALFNGQGLDVTSQYPTTVMVISDKWNCRSYDASNVVSWVAGPSVQYNKWNHFRMEFYGSDKTYSVWVTPQGGDQVQVCNKAGIYKYANYDLRPLVAAQSPNGSLVYYDNIKMSYIDEYAQGYPTVFATKNTITIDGQMNMATEWSDAVKVASRPAGGIGNYRDYFIANYPLSSTTAVDTYVTHDAANFYIATRINNAKWGNAGPATDPAGVWWSNAGLAAVFFVDVDGFADSGMSDIRYVFKAGAGGTSPLSDPDKLDILYAKYVGYVVGASPQPNGAIYGKTLPPGAQINYSVNTTTKIMEIEMKIPFAAMPEIDHSRGAKVGLSFMVREDSTHRATTNLVGQEMPYNTYNMARDYKTANPNVGITFAACGDLAGDFVADCVIDHKDIAEFVAHWLECTKPVCP